MTRHAITAVGLLLAALIAAAAGPLDGEFEVRSATTSISEGVVVLDAMVSYPNTEQISGALRDGVTLAFDLDMGISTPRRYWFDADVIEYHMRRELSYHVISDRYVLRDAAGVEQDSFPTLDAALEYLGRVERMPLLVQSQLRGSGPWNARIRAGVRRGRMPDALRALVFWTDAWHRTSEWYTWKIER